MDPWALAASAAGTAAPVHCAGLRQLLVNQWQDNFPLQESPFQVLAREASTTVREVLGHCRTLQDSGALDGLRLSWGRSMQRVAWRCGLVCGEPPGAELQAWLRALPGIEAWDWIQPEVGDGRQRGAAAAAWPCAAAPDLWFDLVARDRGAAVRQLASLEARTGQVLCLDRSAARRETGSGGLIACGAVACRCERAQGPCTDIGLARRCEQGLPLVAHPYRALAVDLGRSERDVLTALRRWRRQGHVGRVGLAAPLVEAQSLWTFAALSDVEGDASLLQRLLAQPGVVEAAALPGHANWPYRVLVGARGGVAATRGILVRALAAALGRRRVPRWLSVCRTRVRSEPLLFSGIAAEYVESQPSA